MAITNLTNTTWKFKDNINTGLYSTKDFTINFVSNGQNFTSMYGWYPGSPNFRYNDTQVYNSNGWVNEEYKFITIINGEDVENSDLISFLESYADYIKPLEFVETRTALKIYEDLLLEEYIDLKKEPNTFYLVKDVGIYKGETLIAGFGGSLITSDTQYGIELPTEINVENFNSTEFLIPRYTTHRYLFYFIVFHGSGAFLKISQIMDVDAAFNYSITNEVNINNEAVIGVYVAPRTNEYQFNLKGIRLSENAFPSYRVNIFALKI